MKRSFKRNLLSALLTSTLLFSFSANAETAISLYNSKNINSSAVSMAKINSLVSSHFDVNQFRQIKVQVITNSNKKPDHLLVYLFSKKYHRVDVARINIDFNFKAISIIQNYRLTTEDFKQQPGISPSAAKCPDSTIEVIAFAPNYDDLEQQVTKEVADAAETYKFKTLRLLETDATRDNYLNAMACPNLKGNFYDGDANPDVITTSDGVIESTTLDTTLPKQFKFKAINIWLACEAYNDPLKTTMLVTTQSQKYAAGINDLEVGPSDKAAACAFEAAVAGQPMTSSFQDCYKKFDTDADQWGFGGDGSDYFGV